MLTKIELHLIAAFHSISPLSLKMCCKDSNTQIKALIAGNVLLLVLTAILLLVNSGQWFLLPTRIEQVETRLRSHVDNQIGQIDNQNSKVRFELGRLLDELSRPTGRFTGHALPVFQNSSLEFQQVQQTKAPISYVYLNGDGMVEYRKPTTGINKFSYRQAFFFGT